MGYNPYKWYSKGRRKKRLPQSRPLLLRIRNGDFNLSHYIKEIGRVEKEYEETYQEAWDEYPTTDTHARHQHAHQTARMRNVARLKLEEEVMEDEPKILQRLRDGLEDEFGEDLWDEAHQEQRGDGSVEDLYYWYKERLGMGQTPSEIAIQLGRKTTRGLK